jgi:hypothetical protein
MKQHKVAMKKPHSEEGGFLKNKRGVVFTTSESVSG